MTLLQPATPSDSPLKAAIFGPGGSGKTLTSILIAIGLSKERHGSAPIAFVDPEGVSEFIRPVCEAEGVPLLVLPSRTFVDMRDALTEAEQVGCCAFIVDHYDAAHRELTEAQRTALNLVGREIPYRYRTELMAVWDAWVRQFRASPLHCIFNGRLGWEWGDDESDEGEAVKVKLGTKMRGDADAGYEPNLLIELEALQDKATRHTRTRAKTGGITHYAYVLKDRKMILNGLTFKWKDLNQYAKDDYKAVYESVARHLGPVGLSGGHRGVDRPSESERDRSSRELFHSASGESAFAERQRRVTVALEDFQSTLQVLWPGSTAHAKACHAAAIEAIFQTRSWSKVESLTAQAVEEGMILLRACEAALPREADGVAPQNRAEVLAWVLAIQSAQREAAVL